MPSLSLPTGYAAAGAQLFLYQMGGQGIPGREFPAPAVSSGVVIPIMYLTGNSNTYERDCMKIGQCAVWVSGF